MRSLKCLLLLICLSLLVPLEASASERSVKRFALVIGNQDYADLPLKNALNDANAVANQLTDLGFSVTLVLNANLQTLSAEVTNFYQSLENIENEKPLAVIYYAGHSIQIAHTNYLVPLNMTFNDMQQFTAGLYKVSALFEQMHQVASLKNVIILDACRTNPFKNNQVVPKRNQANGLAPIKAPTNTLIAFATEPGGVAADGHLDNGIYTKHLLCHIEKQISVEEVFKKVRAGVARKTRNKQIPWEHSSLLSEVFIHPPKNRDIPDMVVF